MPFPFEAREEQLELRRMRLREAMKAAEQGYQHQPGQMVSGRYVAPSWSQGLAGIVAPMMRQQEVGRQEAQYLNEVGQYKAEDRRASIEHAMSQPQGTPEQHTLPPDQAGPSIPAQRPTSQQNMQWAQQGMNIPSRRAMLEKYMSDQLVNEPVREEERGFRRDESAANRSDRAAGRKEALQARMEELGQRLEDRNLDRASRASIAEQQRALQLQLGQMSDATRREAIAARLGNDPGTTAPKPGKTLPAGTVKDLGELEEKASRMDELSRSFRDEYSGPTGAAKSAVSAYVPGMDTGGSDFWRDYKKQSELVERHQLFGATLTAGEQKAWRAADINSLMKPDVIRANLKERARLSAKVYANSRDRYGNAGYNTEGLGRAEMPRDGGAKSMNWGDLK